MKNSNGRHGLGGCPAPDCSGGREEKQRSILQGELDKVTGKDREMAEARRSSVRICTYCNAVYLRGMPPEQPHLLGFIDSIGHPGWLSMRR